MNDGKLYGFGRTPNIRRFNYDAAKHMHVNSLAEQRKLERQAQKLIRTIREIRRHGR